MDAFDDVVSDDPMPVPAQEAGPDNMRRSARGTPAQAMSEKEGPTEETVTPLEDDQPL